MHLGVSAVALRKGMVTAPVGLRAIGKGMMLQWNRKVYVKMASTALIFSALQPLRGAWHLPVQQHVGPGWVTRGNHSSMLLLRECASTDFSEGVAGNVLLETRECADGSILYKFGRPDQETAASTVVDSNRREDEGREEKIQARLSTEASDPNAQDNGAVELPEDSTLVPVVIVNGVKHSTSPSSPSFKTDKDEDAEFVPDVSQTLAGIAGERLVSDLASTNGILPPAEAPVTDIGSLDTQKSSDEVKKDGTGLKGTPAYLNSGAAMIPHPEKAARGGEDAFFIEGTRWIGVADGVGGWSNNGINAGLYARELMWNCAELARETDKDSDPKTVLIKSFSKTMAQGSTTAVVASISNQTLNVVNIGDSGFLVIRDGVRLHGSTPMIRGFNFPYQIGSEGDDPLLAEVYRVSVKKGDIVILASDGLFDNLFNDEIIAIVNSIEAGSGPEVVAKKLAGEAHKVGARNQGLTPFAREAQKAGYNYFGGKMDDITAVVSFIA